MTAENSTPMEPVLLSQPQPSRHLMRSIAFHALATAFMFVSPLRPFVPAALISCGLRNGQFAAGVVLVLAATIFGILGLAAFPLVTFASLLSSLLLEIGIPAWLGTALMRRGASFGRVLLLMVATSVAGSFAGEALVRSTISHSPYQAIVANFRSDAAGSAALYKQWGFPKEAVQTMDTVSRLIADSFMPFFLTAITIIMFTLSIVMIPRLPAGRSTGATYLFRSLAFPDQLLFVFVLAGLSPLVHGTARMVGLNILATVIFLYFLQGLAIFRAMVVKLNLRMMGNALAYMGLVLFTLYGLAPFVLFLAGLFDSFFDFRNLNRKDVTHESDLD